MNLFFNNVISTFFPQQLISLIYDYFSQFGRHTTFGVDLSHLVGATSLPSSVHIPSLFLPKKQKVDENNDIQEEKKNDQNLIDDFDLSLFDK